MQPQAQQTAFKGDATSVSDTIESYLKAETEYYIEYLGTLGETAFDANLYIQWRFIQNKVNSFRFFLPLVDAVIIDLYVNQNLQLSSEQGFSVGYENYLIFKDSVRESLTLLDPYLITCSFTQTPPSYNDYCQFALFQETQQQRIQEAQIFKQQLINLSDVTYREDVFAAYAFDPNTQALTVPGYQKFFSVFVLEQQKEEDQYDVYMQDLRKSIEGINLFVFNDYVQAIQKAGGQATKEGYTEYYGQVLKKYDEQYLTSKHQQVIEGQRKQKENEVKAEKKNTHVADMNEEEQELAEELENVEDQGYTEEEVSADEGDVQSVEQLSKQFVQLKIKQSVKCSCCKGNVYQCNGQVCQMLGNCICLSE